MLPPILNTTAGFTIAGWAQNMYDIGTSWTFGGAIHDFSLFFNFPEPNFGKGIWYHTAFTYHNGQGYNYINGILIPYLNQWQNYQYQATDRSGTSVALAVFGRSTNTQHQPFSGLIDDVMMWAKPLSDAQIFSIFSGIPAPPPSDVVPRSPPPAQPLPPIPPTPTMPLGAPYASGYGISVTGPPEVVLSHETLCNNPDPHLYDAGQDVAASAYRAADGTVSLMSGQTFANFRSVMAPGTDHFVRDCAKPSLDGYWIETSDVLDPTNTNTTDSFPTMYGRTGPFWNKGACGFWLMSPYAHDDVVNQTSGTVQSFVQTNYCPKINGVTYWYSNVAGAISHDGGATYHFIQGADPAPGVIVSPYKFDPAGSQWFQGTGGVTNTFKNQADGKWYVFAGNPGPSPGACLWQSPNVSDPWAWRGWNGSSFSVISVDPYTVNTTNYCLGVCSYCGSVTWNTVLNAWLAVGDESPYFVYGVSSSLFNWPASTRLFYGPLFSLEDAVPPYAPITYDFPSIIDLDSTDRNFGTSGATPHLYSTRYNPGGTRDTVRFPLTVSFAPPSPLVAPSPPNAVQRSV